MFNLENFIIYNKMLYLLVYLFNLTEYFFINYNYIYFHVHFLKNKIKILSPSEFELQNTIDY